MRLYYVTEQRFVKDNGSYYGLGGFSITLWDRYLEYFEEIIVIARVTSSHREFVNKGNLASKAQVSFVELPYYVGFNGYIKLRKKITETIKRNVFADGVFLCRLPGMLGGQVIRLLNKRNLPYACEVVGNPWDVFARGSISHPLRPLIRIITTLSLKKQLKKAKAALYVTKETLQKSYPVKKGVFNVGVSDVIINDNQIAHSSKVLYSKHSYTIISVGTLDQLYKAPDILIRAIKIVSDRGYNCKLVWLGEGKFLEELQLLSEQLGIREKIDFKGSVPGSEVSSYLMNADIFVLVSRTEGLPRAVLEAMAQGLPCIGSRVGAIPELLPNEVLIDKDDVFALANLIIKMLDEPEFANIQARQNLKVAENYKISILHKQREAFFNYIRTLDVTNL